MKAPNKRRKPKHAMKIGRNIDYIYCHNYFGSIYPTKRISIKSYNCYVSYKFNTYKLRTIRKNYVNKMRHFGDVLFEVLMSEAYKRGVKIETIV